jgi:hypothetical protein
MRTKSWPFVLALVMAGPSTLWGGCETSGDTADSGSGTGTSGTGSTGSNNSGTTSSLDCDDTSDDPTGPFTPVLDPCHDGWKQTYCEEGCHEVPQPNHLPDPVPACAGCHGGNGACTPFDPSHEHLLSEDCIVCHVQSHEYTLAEQCVRCHFAVQGVVDCP